MFKRILVPFDGSGTSDRALTAALQLARESDGCVRIIHSLDELEYLTGFEYSPSVLLQARAQAQKIVDAALERARAAAVPGDGSVLSVAGRRLGEVVADQASEFNADLIVAGTHGRRGVSRVLLGSGAEQIVRLAPVPVLTVRPPKA